jgi:DNA-binding XRE family transcriptional regulator
MTNHRDELETIISELERDDHVSTQAAVLDTAEQLRQQLCLELRQLRTSAPVSQAELARRIGTSQPAIARLEAGLADPKLSTIARYAAALGFELHFNWQRVRAPVATSRESLTA